jgi:hypothetical protein
MIVEPRERGHLLVYVRLIAARALERGHDVVVALAPGASRTSEYQMHLSGIAASVRFVDAPLVLTPRSLNQLTSRVPADVVVVPHGDELAARLGGFVGGRLRTRTRILVMRDPKWDREEGKRPPARNILKSVLLTLGSRRTNAELVWLRGPAHEGAKGERHAVDPFISDVEVNEIERRGASLRRHMSKGDDIFWFGVTGAVSARKNLGLVVDALVSLHARRPEVRVGLAVVGPIDEDVLAVFERARSTLMSAGMSTYFENRLLANEEMNEVVAAVDAVVMAYSTNAPNSTLGKAFVLGTKIVSAGSRAFLEHARFLDGSVATLDAPSLSAAMEDALLQPPRLVRPGALTSHDFADSVLGERTGRRAPTP